MGLFFSAYRDEENGPYLEQLEYLLRERLGDRWPFPILFHDRPSRPMQRIADLEERLSRLEKLGPAMGSFAWALSVGARADDMDQLVALPVRVYLENAGYYPWGLVSAAQRFVEALGFEVVATGAPEVGSFRQRFVTAIRGFFSRKQTQEAIEKGKHALEMQLLDQPQALITKTLAEATAALLSQVKDQNGAVCMQVGSLLLVRYKPDGARELVTVVRTLPPVQLRRLEENQAMLDEPNKILNWLGIAVEERTLPRG